MIKPHFNQLRIILILEVIRYLEIENQTHLEKISLRNLNLAQTKSLLKDPS